MTNPGQFSATFNIQVLRLLETFDIDDLHAAVKKCQSARKTDPLSASKIDPSLRRRDQGLSRRN